MKRHMVIMMIVTLGALCMFNTTVYCGSDVESSEMGSISSDPHDELFNIAASVWQYTIEPGYISGDPHKPLDVEVPRQPKVDGTTYISGDPHDTRNDESSALVVRRAVAIDSIISDPHEERND